MKDRRDVATPPLSVALIHSDLLITPTKPRSLAAGINGTELAARDGPEYTPLAGEPFRRGGVCRYNRTDTTIFP